MLVRPSKNNAVALVALLKQFGFAGSKFTPVDFAESDEVIQLGRAPNRIDLLTSLTGVTNADAFAGKVAADLDGVPVFILGKKS